MGKTRKQQAERNLHSRTMEITAMSRVIPYWLYKHPVVSRAGEKVRTVDESFQKIFLKFLPKNGEVEAPKERWLNIHA
jgi:hypothetical protein